MMLKETTAPSQDPQAPVGITSGNSETFLFVFKGLLTPRSASFLPSPLNPSKGP